MFRTIIAISAYLFAIVCIGFSMNEMFMPNSGNSGWWLVGASVSAFIGMGFDPKFKE